MKKISLQSVIFTVLAYMLGAIHPLQCMQAPSLTDKLVTLRTNLDTLKKSFEKLRQRLEALKNALNKPSGTGEGSSGGQPPGGGSGDAFGSKQKFESLPQEVIKEILSWNITFSFTDSKALYDSIKAAGRELTNLLRTSPSLAESGLTKQPTQIVIMSYLLNEQLKREGKTLDVERTLHKKNPTSQFFKYTVLEFSLDDDNVMICKILLSVDPKRYGEIITDYGINQVVKQPKVSQDFDLIILFLKITDWKRCEYLVNSLFYYNKFTDEIAKHFLDSQDLNDMRILFFMLGSKKYTEQCVKKIIQTMCDPKNIHEREFLIKIFTSGVQGNIQYFYVDDFSKLLKVLVQDPIALVALDLFVLDAVKKNDFDRLKLILQEAGEKKNELGLKFFGGDVKYNYFDYLNIDIKILRELCNALGEKAGTVLVSHEGIINALLKAIDNDNIEFLEEMLKILGDYAGEVIEKSLLTRAVKENKLEMVKNFLAILKNKTANTHCFVDAAVNGNLEMIKILLHALGDKAVEAIEFQDGKPLLSAVEGNNLKIVEALLNALGDRVADVIKMDDNYYKKAFEQAFKKHNNIEIVKALLKAAGDKVDRLFTVQGNEDQTTVLWGPIHDNNITMVNVILQAATLYGYGKQLVELQGEWEKTALHFAVEKRLLKIVQMLLDVVKDDPAPLIKIQDENGDTALHVAAMSPNSEAIIKELLKVCPDCITIKNKEGMTALAKAVNYKNFEAVKALLPKLGTIDASNLSKAQQQQQLIMMIDSNDKTVFHYLVSLDDVNIVKWILNAAGGHAKNLVLKQDKQGNTVLHIMAQDDSIFAGKETIKAVLKAAGDKAKDLVMMKNNDGKTVFDFLRQKSKEIKDLLESYAKK